MIEIRKINDISLLSGAVSQGELCDPDLKFVCVLEGGKIIDYAAYKLFQDKMLIKAVSYNSKDFTVIDGLFKTLRFYADISKIRYIQADSTIEWFAKAFGFKFEDDIFILDIFDQNTACECCDGKE